LLQVDAGDFPAWELGLQIFDEKFAAKQPYDVLAPFQIVLATIVARIITFSVP
jgi:catalase